MTSKWNRLEEKLLQNIVHKEVEKIKKLRKAKASVKSTLLGTELMKSLEQDLVMIYESTVSAVLQYFQLTESLDETFSPDCDLKFFLRNSLKNEPILEEALQAIPNTIGKSLKDLYRLEDLMVNNQVNTVYRDTSLSITLKKGGKVSKYGLVLNHQNQAIDTFDIRSQNLLEEFKTEKSYKVFMKGTLRMTDNDPTKPCRITGYDPLLATAYDVSVPFVPTGDSKSTMRLWRIGQISDVDCTGLEVSTDDIKKDKLTQAQRDDIHIS